MLAGPGAERAAEMTAAAAQAMATWKVGGWAEAVMEAAAMAVVVTEEVRRVA